MRWTAAALTALIIGFSHASRAADEDLVLVGRVTRVVDGDTIDVKLDSGPIRVRLESIDAPEKRQPWGAESTEALKGRLDGKEVELSVSEQDRYERLLATVYVNGDNVNQWLVERGHAWAYTAYLHDRTMPNREQAARSERRGLWALSKPVPPWEWRRGARQPGDEFDDLDDFETPSSDAAKPNFKCGSKRYCADMASCDEARFFLKQCGLSRLDGDGDGVPCEALCR